MPCRLGCCARSAPGEGKKKRKKKKSKANKASGEPLQQTDPPSVPLSKIFTNGLYPEGEICEYKDECVWPSSAPRL